MIHAQTIFEAYVFFLGLMVGSFANVCIFRMPIGRSVVSPRSRCPRCGSKIAWFDNLPILSFLILKARCRHCKLPIGFRYPLIELLTGISAWVLFRKWGFGLEFVYLFVLVSAMIVVTFIDLEHRIIPDLISIPGTLVGLAMAALTSWLAWDWFVTFREALLGVLLGGLLPWGVRWVYEKLTSREGLGMGDIKLLALIGANVGVMGVLSTLFYGSVLGLVAGSFVILVLGKGRRFPIPFGPFLCIGWLYYAFFGPLFGLS